MNQKTISVIALSNRDFPSFAAKVAEAVQWIELAANQGADLAVLPEAINLYKGDGPGNPNALSWEEAALDDWQGQTAALFEAAVRFKIAVAIPVVTRERGHLTNSFFLVSKAGKVLGRYQKMQPTAGELEHGVIPGEPGVFEWEGLKIGGGICFDTNFPRVFDLQAQQGAQLFLVASLWPGGSALNYYALRHSTPIALAYPAWSRIIDIDGREVAEGGYRHETLRFGFGAPVYTATLNFDRVTLYGDLNQQKMDAVQRTYGGQVRIRFDQQNCLFFLESRSMELTVQDVMKRFELVPARDYFSRFKMN
ncbi:MAG: carbon-nitrogen hydrolase family protein [Verrucomicrobia bacterium]|nr:carbon-nitrogen hydrolase family protein [Verrucomicrobiota bacterium]